MGLHFLQSLEWGRTFSSLRSMAGLVGRAKKGNAGEGSDAARRLGRAFARFRGFVTHLPAKTAIQRRLHDVGILRVRKPAVHDCPKPKFNSQILCTNTYWH